MRPLAIVVLFLAGSAGGGNTGQEPLPQGGRWSDEHLWYGKAIAGVGDVDGDGCGDFAVSAPHARWSDGSESGQGIVRLHSGRCGEVLWQSRSRNWCGRSLVCIQDANQDGVPDLALDPGSGNPIVLSGCTGERIQVPRAHPAPSGQEGGPQWSSDVWSDVDGDGVGDLSIATFSAASDAYNLYPAQGSLVLPASDDPDAGDARVLERVEEPLPAGDLDGDSPPEVVLQSLCRISNRESSELRLVAVAVRGGRELWTAALPVCPEDRWTTCPMGDVDADRIGDLAVGVTCGKWWSSDSGHPGSVWILSGRTGGVVHTITAGELSVGFGYRLAATADFDNDGFGDLLVTRYEYLEESLTSGRVHLVSGLSGATLWSSAEPQPDLRAHWEDFGASVACIGDVDGDDLPDLAAGALIDFDGANYPGAVHVYSGASGRWIYSLP